MESRKVCRLFRLRGLMSTSVIVPLMFGVVELAAMLALKDRCMVAATSSGVELAAAIAAWSDLTL